MPSQKKCASNMQRCKVEEKWRDQLNKFNRLQEMKEKINKHVKHYEKRLCKIIIER